MWPETRISGVLSGLFEILKRKNFFCWIGQATVTLLALAWLILFLKSNHLWSLKLITVPIFPLLKLSLNNCKLDLFVKKILSWGSVLYLKILTCMNSCLLCLNRCYVNVTWIYLRLSLVDLTAQKWRFLLRISSVNVNKSSVSRRFLGLYFSICSSFCSISQSYGTT